MNNRALAVLLVPLLSSVSVRAGNLETRSVEGHGGLPLNVVVSGKPDGPSILFIHGMGMGYLSFEPQLKSDLGARYKLVAYDLRGHGNSGKPWRPEDITPSEVWADDMAAVIAATGLRRPVVVAWSLGGFVAADYVRKYGIENLGGINFVGTLAGLVNQPPPGGR